MTDWELAFSQLWDEIVSFLNRSEKPRSFPPPKLLNTKSQSIINNGIQGAIGSRPDLGNFATPPLDFPTHHPDTVALNGRPAPACAATTGNSIHLNRILRQVPHRCRLVLSFAGAFALGAGLQAQSNLLVDPAGQVFFAGQDGVFRIDARAGQIEKLPIPLITSRLLIDAAGNLCGVHMRYETGSDLWRPAVWRFRKGEARIVTGKELADTYAFAEVTDTDGNLYFRDYDEKRGLSRILVRDKARQIMLLAGHGIGAQDGRRESARLGRIGAMTFARDEHLYFTDNGAVRKVDREGVVTTLAHDGLLTGPADTDDNPLTAIAVDDKQNVYVGDSAHHRLLRVDAAGAVTPFAYAGPEWTVTGIACDQGSVFALERNPLGTRVRRIEADLTATVLPVYSPGGALSDRSRAFGLGLEERTILDSPLFRQAAKPVVPRQQLPDPTQPK